MSTPIIDPTGSLAGLFSETFEELGAIVNEVNVKNGWAGSRALKAGIDSGVLAANDKSVTQHQIVELALIMTEASEAIEEIRDGHAINETYYRLPGLPNQMTPEEEIALRKPEGVPSELADMVIRAIDIADAWGIDLGAAIVEKINYNATRGFRHGGKAA